MVNRKGDKHQKGPGRSGGKGPNYRRPTSGGTSGGRGYTGGTSHKGHNTGGCMLAKAVGATILAFIAAAFIGTLVAAVG